MGNYIDILRRKQAKKQKEISEKDFLEAENREKILQEIEHEED